MLGVSRNRISHLLKEEDFVAFKQVSNPARAKAFAYWLVVLVALGVIGLFLPWTQYVTIEGRVTSLRPGERHQTIHSALPGRIEEWYVIEGQRVAKGDTIVKISEIRSEYFNPKLLDRLEEQINAREGQRSSYEKKIVALENQIVALEKARELKVQQLHHRLTDLAHKVSIDSAAFEVAKTQFELAEHKMELNEGKYPGEISEADFTRLKHRLQDAEAKFMAAEGAYIVSQNALANYTIQITQAETEFTNKISTAQSERENANSQLFHAEEEIAKLQNKYENFAIRSAFQYINAPQDGYITKAQVNGIGEIVREGQPIVSIMPKNHELAAELYVDPVDLPLIELHHKVRLQFDGWPAIVSSGWPEMGYGVFAGEIVAVDNMISPNGKYRILVSPDRTDGKRGEWPAFLRLGSGVKGVALLNEVRVYQELWRSLNGFPPEWYDPDRYHPYVHDKMEDARRKGLVN